MKSILSKLYMIAYSSLLCLSIDSTYAQTDTTIFKNRAPCAHQDPPNPFPRIWDWRGSSPYTFYVKDPNTQITHTSTKLSPWFDNSNANPNTVVFRYQNPKDYDPEDGWVLIQRNFGFPNHGTNHPYFILYNKYTGILRIFVAITKVASGYNKAVIRLSFAGSTQTALLEAHAPTQMGLMQPLESFTNKIKPIEVGNSYHFDLPYWLHADFTLTYDPCTCDFLSKLLFDVYLVSNTSLNFTLAGTVTGIDDIGRSTSGAGNQSLVKDLKNDINEGLTAYKDAQDGIDKFRKLFKDANQSGKDKKEFGDMAIPFGSSIAFLSGIKGVLGLFDFFVNGGTKNKPAKSQTASFKVNLTATGQLTTVDGQLPIYVETPGSDNLQLLPPTNIEYNNVLGIMNVVRAPKITSDVINTWQYCYPDPIEPWFTICDYGYVNRYQLAEDVKYVVNPHAGFDINQSTIQAAIYFEAIGYDKYRPFSFWNTNLIFTNDSTWRTPFMSLSCLREFVAEFNQQVPGQAYYHHTYVIRPVLKLNAILRGTKPNGDIQETVYMARYQMKDISSRVPIVVAHPSYLNYDSYTTTNPISQDVSVWTSIKIEPYIFQDLVYSSPNNITLKAGEEITLTCTPLSSLILEPHITFEIGLPGNCSTTFVQPYDSIANFCQSSLYRERAYTPRTNSNQVSQEAKAEGNERKGIWTIVYPNPASGLVRFNYTFTESNPVELTLSNLQGQEVANILKKDYMEAGSHEIQYDVSKLPKGIYIYTLRVGSCVEVKKLVIE